MVSAHSVEVLFSGYGHRASKSVRLLIASMIQRWI